MFSNKKITAFTVHELILVLILSSMVISIALSILGFVQNQMGAIRRTLEVNTEIRLAERILWQDVSHGNRLFYDRDNHSLAITTPVDTVTYHFGKRYVLRNKDTLGITVHVIKTFLNAAEVTAGFVDAVKLTVEGGQGATKNIFVYKSYDASFYINQWDGI